MKKIILIFIIFLSLNITIKDPYKFNLNTSNLNLKSKLENNYHLNIYLKDSIIKNFPNFKTTVISNDYLISNFLFKLNNILTKFPSDFFNSFYSYNYQGLNIYLSGKLIPNDQSLNPVAYSLDYNKKYMMIIDISSSKLEETICHELMHNIEFNIAKTKEVFPEWELYNPPGFYYNYSYQNNFLFNYTLDDIPSNVYFIDYYSHTYPEEDRARIFEKICAYNTDLKYYPPIHKKALYLTKEILNNYPILKESSIFNNF